MNTDYSCLMSVYINDNPTNLAVALDSILNQTIPPKEIVLVKDGPLSEELESLICVYDRKQPGVFKFLELEHNHGLWFALAQGLMICSNELVMRMDADDISRLDRAELEINFLNSHESIACVGTLISEFIESPDKPVSYVQLPQDPDSIYKFGKYRCPFRHPTIMFRKTAVLNSGNYQQMPYFEDYDLYMRMTKKGYKFYNIQKILLDVRTDKSFYRRRGGISYLKDMLYFKTACLRRGNYGVFTYLVGIVPHLFVCLIPNSFREFIYRNFLRKSIN